ncbi:MAG: HlyD family efflux transporter periplasmic adaptor subunit [Bryobacterales bacterium]|nr:HlyD family efflux transporter periplasmic adaptor subunit [Bryobacterales bacterium]
MRSGLIVAGAAGLTAATMMLYGPAPPELPTAEVERRDFLRTVTTRGELKSAMSVQIVAPQTPDLKIVQLAENGRPITEGAIIVQFDESAQEDLLIERETEVRQVDSEIEQAEAQHAITDERNEMMVMQATYNLERAELEASKQEILAEIEAEKAKIDVVIAKGELTKSETNAEASDMSQAADMERLIERKSKAIRDLDLSKTYLGSMLLRAPRDGIVHILPNNRAQGSFGTARPPFQEGDTVWTGAAIAEIPDLESLRVEFRVDEVDRGRVEEGQETRIRIDAVPDALLSGAVSWLSPIATLVFNRLPPEKNFPAHSGIDDIDDRLRPGMSATVEIVVQRISDVLVIPNKASTQIDGKPTVFVKDGPGFQRRPIEVSATNGTEIVVASGLEEGDVIALENPELADQGRTL